jgi:hypothetical protein
MSVCRFTFFLLASAASLTFGADSRSPKAHPLAAKAGGDRSNPSFQGVRCPDFPTGGFRFLTGAMQIAGSVGEEERSATIMAGKNSLYERCILFHCQ